MTTRGFLRLTDPKKKPPGKQVGPVKSPGLSKSLGQTWLKLSMDNHREDKRPMWGPVKQGGWHPSSLGEVCDRVSLLKMVGYRGDLIGQQLSRIFDMGKAIEKMWQEDFRRMGILLSSNVRLQDPGPPPINGEYDVMIRHPFEPNRRLLGEIKSINDRGFKCLPPLTLDHEINYNGIMNTTGDIGARIRGYMIQFQSYLRLTKMEEGFILFDNKNDSNYNDYLLAYHPELVDSTGRRIIRLEPYRAKLIVPVCTCDGSGYNSHKGPCLYKPQADVPLDELKRFMEDTV